jgi:hypothetical protein
MLWCFLSVFSYDAENELVSSSVLSTFLRSAREVNSRPLLRVSARACERRQGGNGAPVQPQKTVRSDLGLLGELGLNKVLQSTGLGGLCELAVADFLPLVSCEET